MAPALSKLIQNPRYLYSGAAFGAIIYLLSRTSDNSSPSADSFVRQSNKDERGKEKAHLDALFFKRLRGILKIMIPGWKSSEAFWMIVVAAMLITRTRFDVWMISNGTSIESAIIDRNMPRFIKYLSKFIFSMPAIALTNQILKYGLNSLKLQFRKRFTLYIYNKYLQGYTYYKMSNLDNRIANADQLLTQDVEKFCNSIVDLYSNLSKPLLDIIIYIYKLTGTVGAQGPATMIGYLVFSGLILTRMRRPTGKLTINEQKLEGEFRYVNSRLITNSEEIAFYHGNKKERHTLLMAFENLYQHLRKFIFFRFKMGLVDDIIAKYTATTFGYLIVSRPFLDLTNTNLDNKDHSELLEEYYKTGRMLVRLSQAIGRIVLAGREMTRLAGFTARITDLIKVTDELNSGTYSRTMVSRSSLSNLATEDKKEFIPGSGKIIIEDYIIHFDKVPLVTPNGDVLVDEMTFEVKSGANVLVCGPNGCGKSSLFRVLGELWPIFGGVMTKPARGNLFYVPQRPYMTLGTLRDQVIYPDTVADMEKKKITDEKLEEFLTEVQLGILLDREGGWDAVQDWMDVLSGGEKQRMAMARLFYHQPQFAILDECTSAVSVDVESFIYQRCREVGITLFTVSHRKSLWKHHEFFLHMDGRGKYEFGPIDEHTVEFGS